jgi:hypothetical protein
MNMKNIVAWCGLALALTACGGGGGGGGSGGGGGGTGGGGGNPPPVVPPPEVKVLSGAIARYAAQNSSVAFEVQIKPSFTPSGTLYVTASDKAGVIQSLVTVTPNTDGSYALSLGTATSAAPGHYAGDITLKLCADQACAAAQAVPSVSVPYDLTVVAPNAAWPGDRLTALVPWTGVADWSTFQGNAAHTGYVPVDIKADQIVPRWKTGAITQSTGSFYGYGYFSTLTAANGIFYAAGDKLLKARKESDGSLVWSYDVSGLAYPSVNPPAVDNGIVYMAAGQQSSTFMFGFDAASGAVRFKAPMSSQWENYLAPVALGDAVYTNAGAYGGLYAFTPNGDQMFFGNTAQTSMWSPAVDANAVYVYDGTLHVFDRKTGKVLGEIKDLNYQNYVYEMDGSVVLGAEGSAFVANYAGGYLGGGTTGNELLKFNTLKGFIDWRIAGNYPLTPAYANGVLYVVNTRPYRIEARAEADGALLWSWVPGQAAETAWKSEPVVTKNLLFVSTNAATYAVDLRTHKPVWSYPFGGRLALTRSGILYIQNEEALVAINLK